MEVLKIIISALTPVSVVIVGYYLNRRLKSIDNAQWQNRKIVEKRIDLYDQIAPNLNAILCFFHWFGHWKDMSPKDIIATKRELDRIVHIYRHLLSDDFYEAYTRFIKLTFKTYSAAGKDALILSKIVSSDGDRRKHANYLWEHEYAELFLPSLASPKAEIHSAYNETMEELRSCIGILEPEKTLQNSPATSSPHKARA